MAVFPVLEVRTARGGHGVFAGVPIAAGRVILQFAGERVDFRTIAEIAAAGGHDGYLQIGEDSFLGHSDTADDYINHSCEPNAYVLLRARRALLVALADIAAGTEIVFDYALTQVAFPFRFRCLCGTQRCRGVIGDYDEMPAALLSRYRALGALPPYIVARLDDERRAHQAGHFAVTALDLAAAGASGFGSEQLPG